MLGVCARCEIGNVGAMASDAQKAIDKAREGIPLNPEGTLIQGLSERDSRIMDAVEEVRKEVGALQSMMIEKALNGRLSKHTLEEQARRILEPSTDHDAGKLTDAEVAEAMRKGRYNYWAVTHPTVPAAANPYKPEELQPLPCPFCGNENVSFDPDIEAMVCSKRDAGGCGANGPMLYVDGEEPTEDVAEYNSAVAEWNKAPRTLKLDRWVTKIYDEWEGEKPNADYLRTAVYRAAMIP